LGWGFTLFPPKGVRTSSADFSCLARTFGLIRSLIPAAN